MKCVASTVFKKIVKGYARKLEITYNEERDDYHPYFHWNVYRIKKTG